MGPGAEGRRRRSNAAGAKPPAASELAQIERGDHVERGARADLEFGGGHGGGHEGFCEDQIRKRRQTRIPPLAAAAPFEARPGGRETITFGEPPFGRGLEGGEMWRQGAPRVPSAGGLPKGRRASPTLTQGDAPAPCRGSGADRRRAGAEPKVMFGRGEFLPGLIRDGRGEGRRQVRGRLDPRTPLRKKRRSS